MTGPSPHYALVFDFDGVVLDSATLKRQAFADLYTDAPESQYRAVCAYLGRKGGQPREVKFRHIEAHILGRPANEERIRELCARFKSSVEQRLLHAPAIPGALEFLSRWATERPLYLLSATPEAELRGIVAQRGLAHFFQEVVGSPPDKVTGLRNLMARWGYAANETVMIGDSYNDYRAARSNGTRFVGVTADPEVSPFPDETITVRDLHGLEAALAQL
ncbi:HAD family hydrolase [Billgrantia tianxiuensis]|uniref:phosphoglycolate phosphatase n=1 Tax=Billgrantia tianxiuensis TaxID=2497861 RepID=A0A6I6SSF3_9GAMM|nr:HAD family hydrolase [Halomonas tianxiuensis]MCE8035544.1 HAD family hydrolase [Halomonas sp. MCCC 1A11057]QHC51664.1 HAD family hydrolase [Halomonas tianxiuensis]